MSKPTPVEEMDADYYRGYSAVAMHFACVALEAGCQIHDGKFDPNDNLLREFVDGALEVFDTATKPNYKSGCKDAITLISGHVEGVTQLFFRSSKWPEMGVDRVNRCVKELFEHTKRISARLIT